MIFIVNYKMVVIYELSSSCVGEIEEELVCEVVGCKNNNWIRM